MTPLLRLAALALACAALPAAAQDAPPPPAGTYVTDKTHTVVAFSVNHLGLSEFVATFDTIEGTLEIDPDDPAAARLSVRIPVASLDLPAEAPGFRETLMSDTFFDAAAHPDITFVSDIVTLTGARTADVAGTLTIRGTAQPVTLAVTYNDGYGPNPWEPYSRIGFSATTAFDRSDFGMGFGVPPEGSTFGVGDRIDVRIEAELIQPAP